MSTIAADPFVASLFPTGSASSSGATTTSARSSPSINAATQQAAQIAANDPAYAASLISNQTAFDLITTGLGLTTTGASNTDPMLATLQAAYLQPLANAYSAIPTASGGTNVAQQSYSGGVSLSADRTAAPGNYSLAYDPSTQTFSLSNGSTTTTASLGKETANPSGTGEQVKFGNGITVNLDNTFNPVAALGLMSFQVPYNTIA